MTDNTGPTIAAQQGYALGLVWKSLMDAMNAFGRGFQEAAEGKPSSQTRKGREALGPEGLRKVIRVNYPKGVQGDLNASLEWQKAMIDRATDDALARLDALRTRMEAAHA